MRIAQTVCKPRSISQHREEARVVFVPFLDDCVECPLHAAENGKVWRPVAVHNRSGYVLDNLLRGANTLPKLSWSQRGYTAMVGPVRSNLVPVLRDLANETWGALSYP